MHRKYRQMAHQPNLLTFQLQRPILTLQMALKKVPPSPSLKRYPWTKLLRLHNLRKRTPFTPTSS